MNSRTIPLRTDTGALPLWSGRILSAIVVIALLADAFVGLFMPQLLDAGMTETGFPAELSRAIGIIILACVLLYAIPRTSVLGAILITGFLGGAICTHFRLGQFAAPPQIVCTLLGLMTWAGLYLRFPALRALLPLNSAARLVTQPSMATTRANDQ